MPVINNLLQENMSQRGKDAAMLIRMRQHQLDVSRGRLHSALACENLEMIEDALEEVQDDHIIDEGFDRCVRLHYRPSILLAMLPNTEGQVPAWKLCVLIKHGLLMNFFEAVKNYTIVENEVDRVFEYAAVKLSTAAISSLCLNQYYPTDPTWILKLVAAAEYAQGLLTEGKRFAYYPGNSGQLVAQSMGIYDDELRRLWKTVIPIGGKVASFEERHHALCCIQEPILRYVEPGVLVPNSDLGKIQNFPTSNFAQKSSR